MMGEVKSVVSVGVCFRSLYLYFIFIFIFMLFN